MRTPSSPGGSTAPQPTDAELAPSIEPPADARSYRPPTLTIARQLEPDQRGHGVRDRHPCLDGRRASGSDPPSAFHTLPSLVGRGPAARAAARPIDAEVVQEVVGASDHRRAVADHLERRLRERTRHRSRHGEDLTSELERVIDGDPGAAPRLALHHHQRTRERHDDPVPCREVLRSAGTPGGYSLTIVPVRRSPRAGPGCSPGRRRRSPSRAPRPCGPPPGARPRVRQRRSRAPRRTRRRARRPRARARGPARRPARGPSTSASRRSRHGRATLAERPPEEEEARRRIREVEQPVVVLGIRRRDEPGPGAPPRERRSRRGRSAAATRGRRRCPAGRDEPTRRIRAPSPTSMPPRAPSSGRRPRSADSVRSASRSPRPSRTPAAIRAARAARAHPARASTSGPEAAPVRERLGQVIRLDVAPSRRGRRPSGRP